MRRQKIRLLAAAAAALGAALLGLLWHALVADLPHPGQLYDYRTGASTRILDRRGRLLYEIADPHRGHHVPVPLEDIPLACQQATVATEDANFYTNPGVDIEGIARAVWINLQGGEVLAGGSTITQQLARNLLMSPEERAQRTLLRKLRESILAWRIARSFSKGEILALYLNEVYYGNLAYGIQAAAQTYFAKPPGALSLAECALLAGLPQSPATYDPLTYPEAAAERQQVVLRLMAEQGFISPQQRARSAGEPLHFAATPFPISAPHFVMSVWGWLESRFGQAALYSDGLVVTTTLDLDLQRTAEAVTRRHLQRLAQVRPDEPLHNVNNAALVALDPRSGQVLALLGSPDYFDPSIDGAVNVALAPRQPGSAIKPVTYAAALDPACTAWDGGPLTAGTVLLDVRTSFPTREGLPYVPANYDRRFHGPVSVREALACSYNVPAVRTLQEVGIDTTVGLARRLGISTFEDTRHFGLALTLGGGEVRLLELTAAYAAFANGGLRVQPLMVLSVGDAAGRVRYQAPRPSAERVLDARVAYLITDILSDEQARAPAFGEHGVLSLRWRPAAVKTGTTSDWRDNWTVGYTPQLVVGVWAGNANGAAMEHVSGVDGAGPIWHDFMEVALRGQPALAFEQPPGLVRVEICALSGLLPTEHCPRTRSELFIDGTQPTQTDTWYQPFAIDRRSGAPAGARTPAEYVREEVFVVLPQEAREWAHQQGWPEPPVGGEQASTPPSPQPLIVTAPDPGTIYRLSSAVPAATQVIRVAARPADGVHVQQMWISMDGRTLATFDGPPFELFWTLAAGEHTVVAQGIDGAGRTLESAPLHFTVRP